MQLFLVIGEEFSAQDLMFSQAYLRKLKLTLGLAVRGKGLPSFP